MPTNRIFRSLWLFGALAVIALLSGCGGSSFDSAATGEHLIRDYVTKNDSGPSKIDSLHIKCPAGVAAKVGGTYVCSMSIKLTTPEGSSSSFAYKVTVHMVAGDKVETGKQDFQLQ